jgi:gamma-glutamylcyclotransferase (GGCT)/AIG2-like uncharacterized protein YtfP
MYLFSYGTLQEKKIQEGLFGEQIPMIDGRLEGYVLRLGSDGYYNLEPSVDSSVEGKLLKLDERQILCADQWEEVPVYEREIKHIAIRDGMVEGWVFFKTEEQAHSCPDHIPDKMTSGFECDELSVIFNTFLRLKTLKEGFADVYFAIPLSECDLQGKKISQKMPTKISELSIISLPHKGYEIKHIAFMVQVSKEHTYVIIGVPVSIRTPEDLLKSIFENKRLLEDMFSVTLRDTSKVMLFKSHEGVAVKPQALIHSICFNKPFSKRLEEESEAMMTWLLTF